MNIDIYYLNNQRLLDDKINFFKKTKQLINQEHNHRLVLAHLDKAKHNLKFFDKNKDDDTFNDWLIVILYYTLYHCALALVTNKNYTSKNHTATLLFLIKYYSIHKEDAELIEELLVSKEDATFYTELKFKRHIASYKTETSFTHDQITNYKVKVIEFIQKVEDIIKNHADI
ncbi:MAG: DNA-binding protein [DPANN group archaeon]|nr:DNA-binding protein [DPANN group archaeon]